MIRLLSISCLIGSAVSNTVVHEYDRLIYRTGDCEFRIELPAMANVALREGRPIPVIDTACIDIYGADRENGMEVWGIPPEYAEYYQGDSAQYNTFRRTTVSCYNSHTDGVFAEYQLHGHELPPAEVLKFCNVMANRDIQIMNHIIPGIPRVVMEYPHVYLRRSSLPRFGIPRQGQPPRN